MTWDDSDVLPLQGINVISLAINVPGPVAVARLRDLGASVTRVEPPAGDPLAAIAPEWYKELTSGQTLTRLDLKKGSEREELGRLLSVSDLLITSSRPAALARLALDWPALHQRFPRLSQVAIVGYPAPHQNVPGHDLTYLASLGLITPPRMPRTLLADLAGAERVVSAALALLLAVERGHAAGYREVSLSEAAAGFTPPLHHGLTGPHGLLGGTMPRYNLYPAQDGWIALAALETHFWQHVLHLLGLRNPTYEELADHFRDRSIEEWEAWAIEHDVPLKGVEEPQKDEDWLHLLSFL